MFWPCVLVLRGSIHICPITRSSPKRIGWYLMKSGRYHKIARTGHVGGRERDLAIQLPARIITVHSIRTIPSVSRRSGIKGSMRSEKTASALI